MPCVILSSVFLLYLVIWLFWLFLLRLFFLFLEHEQRLRDFGVESPLYWSIAISGHSFSAYTVVHRLRTHSHAACGNNSDGRES